MTPQPDVRRRPDGSIDIDFYRHKGLMQRRLVLTGFFRGARKPLAAAALAIVMLCAVAPRDMAAIDSAASWTSVTR